LAQVGEKEGALQIEDSVIWWVRSSSFSPRLYQGVSSGPIYSLASFLEGLEAIFIEAEFLVFYSQEGTLQIEDSVIWGVRSPSFSLRLYQGVSSGPIYSLASLLEGLEAIFIEAEFLVFYSQEGRIMQRDDIT
jgi:hypothetical protein